MKALIATMLVASAVTLGGCHVFKPHADRQSAGVTVMPKQNSPVLSLQSLDARMKVIEARNARLDRPKGKVSVQGQPLK